MAAAEFNSEHLTIVHPGVDVESFPLVGGAAFQFFDDEGAHKLAIELGTDWVDFEDSELIGESETLACVWGIPVTAEQVRKGVPKPLRLEVADEDRDGRVAASFFASIGHRVDHVVVEFPGEDRVRLALHIDDITEETNEANTVVTFDTSLKKKTKLERPV